MPGVSADRALIGSTLTTVRTSPRPAVGHQSSVGAGRTAKLLRVTFPRPTSSRPERTLR